MALQFGKTWWGKHWLRSLENVDYQNRLPRGASYARSGHVIDLKIKGNQIAAKVSGSQKKPYTVNIIIPPFFEDQINLLMQGIINRPVVISKLLNRELDPEILQIAENNGLKVFPSQWTDFKMQCSCPDWAVPCKHLASVIYMISREIDNNPFLVFELHNVDLIKELSDRGIFVSDTQKTEVPLLSSLLKTISKNIEYDANKVYNRVDFSNLNPIAENLVLLLVDNPPFYSNSNFKEKFSTLFLKSTKTIQRLLSKKTVIQALYPNAADATEEKYKINNKTTAYLNIDLNNQITLTSYNPTFENLEELIPQLYQINANYLMDYQPSIVGLYKILFASLQLIALGNIVPEIIKLQNKDYAIRWLPAKFDAKVNTLICRLKEILPADLLTLTKKSDHIYIIEDQTTNLLSIFITEIISKTIQTKGVNIFEDLFFQNISYSFSGVGEHELPGGIKVWLDRFFMTNGDYRPIIIIEEKEDSDFEVHIDIEKSNETEQLPIPLENIFDLKKHEQDRFQILKMLSLLSPFVNGLDNYVNTKGRNRIHLDLPNFSPFLMEIIPALKLLDVKVLLPKSLNQILKPQTSLELKKSSNPGGIRLDDLLAFDWKVALGKDLISVDEFNALLKNAHGLFRYKEKYIYVNEEEMEAMHKHFTKAKDFSTHQLLQIALSQEYHGAPITLTDEVKQLMDKLTSNEEIALPENLNATLRPYQHRGFSWMYKNSRIGFGSIIADDMGLGKTLQVISFLLKLKEEGAINMKQKALVVVPTGLLNNWENELLKFAPSLSSHIFHGGSRDIKEFKNDIMLTTYGVLRSELNLLKKQNWEIMIIDEAQNIKNEATQQTKAIKSIPAKVKIAMSGTPVENRLSEFWSIMDFANKGYLGNAKAFKEEYGDPIQVLNSEEVINRFKKVTAPFMMRRMKNDKSIISDLPDKIEQNQLATLTKKQAAIYEKTMEKAMEQIEGFGSDADSLFKRQGLVLQMILALKQICNHPTNFLKNGNHDASISGKVELLFDLLDRIIEAGEKVLIFTQFKEMGELLQHFIEQRFSEKPIFYHGGCTLKERQSMVDRFQNNRADKIFILSLKAAGTGLNLTAASHVIHFDLWWNPAVENQATDRAYRIGQKNNVMVHRLITKNTFEEKINDMIQKKKNLADMTVATGENWIGKLSNKELREIFG